MNLIKTNIFGELKYKDEENNELTKYRKFLQYDIPMRN